MTMNPPTLKVERYYVYRDDEDPYEAKFLWADNLRAELEASKRGVKPSAAPMLYLTITVWAHAVRTGRTTLKFDEWSPGVLDIDDADKSDKRAERDGESAPEVPGDPDPT